MIETVDETVEQTVRNLMVVIGRRLGLDVGPTLAVLAAFAGVFTTAWIVWTGTHPNWDAVPEGVRTILTMVAVSVILAGVFLAVIRLSVGRFTMSVRGDDRAVRARLGTLWQVLCFDLVMLLLDVGVWTAPTGAWLAVTATLPWFVASLYVERVSETLDALDGVSRTA